MQQLPIEKKFEIIDDYRSGIADVEILAFRHGVPADIVDELIEELKNQRAAHNPNVEILRTNITRLQNLADLAEWEYKTCPDVDNATAVTSLIGTMNTLIKEIESRSDPADTLNQILVEAIQPSFRQLIKRVSEMLRRLNERVVDAIPQQHHQRVEGILKDSMREAGSDASDIYREIAGGLARSLGCKPEDEKVTPMLKAVSSDEKKKEAANS